MQFNWQAKQVISNIAALHTWCLRTPGVWENRFEIMGKDSMSTWPQMMKEIAKQLVGLDATMFTEKSLDDVNYFCP
jgi:hypothetical protein